MGALIKKYISVRNPGHPSPQKIQIFSKSDMHEKSVYKKFLKFVKSRYNESMYFTFWRLVKTNAGYVFKKHITIYEDMIEYER